MSKRVLLSLIAAGTILLVGAGCKKALVTPNPNNAPAESQPSTNETPVANDAVSANQDAPVTAAPTNTTPVVDKPVVTPEPTPAPTPAPTTQTFTITGDNFSYDTKSIKVKQGDMVRIIFKNAEGTHDLKIDEFNVATKKLGVGAEEMVQFTADKKGSFEYYCSVGSHRAMGMKGTLTVE